MDRAILLNLAGLNVILPQSYRILFLRDLEILNSMEQPPDEPDKIVDGSACKCPAGQSDSGRWLTSNQKDILRRCTISS